MQIQPPEDKIKTQHTLLINRQAEGCFSIK